VATHGDEIREYIRTQFEAAAAQDPSIEAWHGAGAIGQSILERKGPTGKRQLVLGVHEVRPYLDATGHLVEGGVFSCQQHDPTEHNPSRSYRELPLARITPRDIDALIAWL
jgi:hypothetical protein